MRSRRQWQEQELEGCTGAFAPGAGAFLHINLPADGKGCRASDLFLLKLSAAATPSLGVRKQGQLLVTWTLSNGKQRTHKAILPQDGMTHELLVSACTFEDPFLTSFFHPSRCQRSRSRASRPLSQGSVSLRRTALRTSNSVARR